LSDNQEQSKVAKDFIHLYEELKKIAERYLAKSGRDQTLSPTALVNEAYIRLVGSGSFEDQSHFYRSVAQAMRHILVDHSRRKHAKKRGSGSRMFRLTEDLGTVPLDPDGIITLNEAMEQLEAVDPVSAEVAKLRIFAGLSIEEAGAKLGMSRATAFREWNFARAYLLASIPE